MSESRAPAEERTNKGTSESTDATVATILDQRDAMLRLVAHDIRAPLGVITGALSEVTHPSVGSLNDEQKMLLTLVKRSADRLARLATNLSYVSRIQSGHLAAARMPQDAQALVKHAVKTFTDNDDAGGMTIHVNVPEGVKIAVDREQMTVAIGNLLANAVRFARSRIDVRLEPSGAGGKEVHLIVEDDGNGIPPDAGDLFDRLNRRTSAKQSGSGLGLGIVRGVAIANGGDAKAENAPREGGGTGGARFTIVLPVAS